MIPYQGLHGGHERPGNQQKVAVEHADQFEESVESRHDFAGLDAGYVHLRQTQTLAQLGLAPAAFVPRLDQFMAERFRQTIRARRLEMR